MLPVSQLLNRLTRAYEDRLSEIVLGTVVYPLHFERIGTPTSTSEMAAWREWVEELATESKSRLGYGYDVQYEERSYGRKGVHRVPVTIHFVSENDFLARVGKQHEVAKVRADLVFIARQVPKLGDWAKENIRSVRLWHGEWAKLLEVVAFFQANPRPNIYRREVPIPIPDKFIEQNQGPLRELLDFVLPSEAINPVDDFGERFGLKGPLQMVRARIPTGLRPAGFWATDAAMPLADWVKAPIAPCRILVVENLTTYLSIPLPPEVPVVMGSGWSASRLALIPWIKSAEVFYTGDLDVPGFEILAALRANHGNVRSVMMGPDVLQRFGELAVPHQVRGDTDIEVRLTIEEAKAWRVVKESRLQLAQEKLPFPFILTELQKALGFA
jgi:hypothetical protein